MKKHFSIRKICAQLLITFFILAFGLLGHAENPPTDHQVERLARAFIFTQKPKENPKVEFKIKKIEINGLWEGLQIEVFDAEGWLDGQPMGSEFIGAYHNGKITALTGMYSELMSGLVSSGQFYYTYCWGSGIGRSQVARLWVANDKLEIVKSAQFLYQDLIVSADPGGKVRVLSGNYIGNFNHCEKAKDFGFVGSTNSSGLQIVDAKGKVITP